MDDPTEGQRIYAIGDIHGRRDLLEEMVTRILGDMVARPHTRPRLICLGDYVDRGPDVRGVIETLITLQESDLPTVFLLGNHDACVADFLEGSGGMDRGLYWLDRPMGGSATLASYGVVSADAMDPEDARDAFAAALPPGHRAFLDDCALSHRIGDYVFVHAGIRPGVLLQDQRREDLIWIREPFLSSTRDFGFKVVHGHTIVPKVEHHSNRIAIDTGAVRSGVLSCLVLEGATVALLEADGPRPWPEGSGRGLSGLGATMRRGLLGRGAQG